MSEFRVTFGQRFRREPHPRLPDAHPDGWLSIDAADYDTARAVAVGELGTAWAFIYEPPFDEQEWLDLYPRGRVGLAEVRQHPACAVRRGGVMSTRTDRVLVLRELLWIGGVAVVLTLVVLAVVAS